MFNKNIANVEYYKVFLDFNREILKEGNKVLKEIVRFDYLCFNKKEAFISFYKI